jgi:hypothetical protein
VWGGGGGGGPSNNTGNNGGGGGGGGAYASKAHTLSPGTTYYFDVGGGGSSSAGNTNATAGGTSQFRGGAANAVSVSAGGGGGGVAGRRGGTGGVSGNSTSGADVSHYGGNGATKTSSNQGGGGAGSGGTGANGNNGSGQTGATARSGGGGGGNGGNNTDSGNAAKVGAAGSIPGGGGGGAGNARNNGNGAAGGAGANGQVVITWSWATHQPVPDVGSSTASGTQPTVNVNDGKRHPAVGAAIAAGLTVAVLITRFLHPAVGPSTAAGLQPTVKVSAPSSGSSFLLNAATKWLSRSTSLLSAGQSYTAMAWVKVTNRSTSSAWHPIFSLCDTGTLNDEAGVTYDVNGLKFDAWMQGPTAGWEAAGYLTTSIPSEWHHIAYVYDVSGTTYTLTIYLDGAVLGTPQSQTQSGSRYSPTAIMVGAWPDIASPSDYFTASDSAELTAVKFWQAKLTESEINTEKDSAAAVKSGCLGCLIDETGTDLTGTGNFTVHGSITAGASYPDITWPSSGNVTRTPSAGASSAAGLQPTVKTQRFLRPAVGPSTAGGLQPAAKIGRYLSPSVGASTAAGLQPTLNKQLWIRPSAGAATAGGQSATVTAGRVIVNSPSIAAQNTTVTNALGPDGCTWAQADAALVVDQYGKLIACQQQNADGCWLTYSNNGGATWADGLQQSYITRGSIAYDSVHDQVHVLWSCQASADGILYRRYAITRDGSHNITGIARDSNNINLQLDYETGGQTVWYGFPTLFWLNDSGFGSHGAILALWTIYQETGTNTGGELRASLRVLSNTAADGTGGNWVQPAGAGETARVDQPSQVGITRLHCSSAATWVQSSAARKAGGTNAKDVYVAYLATGTGNYKARRMRWNAGANDWSTGLSAPVTLSALVRSGSDAGYSFKGDLLTRPREDTTNDKMVVGLATWRNNTSGDSWGYVRIANDDTVGSLVDVYYSSAANCASDIFITGDLVVEQGYVVATYTDLPRKDAYVRCFDSSDSEAQAASLIYNGSPVDIPTFYQVGGSARVNFGSGDRLLVFFRDYNTAARSNPPTYTPPYYGYFGTLTWALATSGNVTLTPSVGSAAASGLQPAVRLQLFRTPAAGASAGAGLQPAVRLRLFRLPSVGPSTAAGLQPSVKVAVRRYPAAGASSAAGLQPVVKVSPFRKPSLGAATAAGLQPGVKVATWRYPSAGGAVGTGLQPIVKVSPYRKPSVGPSVGAGLQPAVQLQHIRRPAVGASVAGGLQPAVPFGNARYPSAGSAAAGGLQPSVKLQLFPKPGAGQSVAAGLQPIVRVSSIRKPSAGSAAAAGLQPTVRVQSIRKPGAGATSAAGLQPVVRLRLFRLPGAGGAVAAGLQPALRLQLTVRPNAGATVAAGTQPGVTSQGARIPTVGASIAAGLQPAVRLSLKRTPGTGAAVAGGLQPAARITRFARPLAGASTAAGTQPTIGKSLFQRPAAGASIAGGAAPAVRLRLWRVPASGQSATAGLRPAVILSLARAPQAGQATAGGTQPTVGVAVVRRPQAGASLATGTRPAVIGLKLSEPGAGVSSAQGLTVAVRLQLSVRPAAGPSVAEGSQPSVGTSHFFIKPSEGQATAGALPVAVRLGHPPVRPDLPWPVVSLVPRHTVTSLALDHSIESMMAERTVRKL